LFASNLNKFYDILLQGNERSEDVPLPPRDETLQFWKSIWSSPCSYNNNNAVLQQPAFSNCEHMTSLDELTMAIKRLPNWKSPGLDSVYGYWLSSVRLSLHYYFNQLLAEPSQLFPSLLAGRTILIMKDKAKGNIPSNYRPITSLSNVWKLLSSIV